MKTDVYKYVHSPPSADSRRVLVSFKLKYVQKVLFYTPIPHMPESNELPIIWIRGLKRTQFAKILIITETYNP